MSVSDPATPRPRAAVLGSPIEHSLSPVLHRAAYAACGLDWDYTAIECDVAALPAFLARLRAEPGWRGLSLTMPLKLAAVPLVDETVDEVREVGALNTIVVSADTDGAVRLVGHNTDIHGIAAAIAEIRVGIPERPVILGAGGTARAAVAALAGLGASSAVVVARDVTRTRELLRLGERLGIEVVGQPWTAVREQLSSADLVVSTTPAGATDALADDGIWPDKLPLLDVVYEPWPTKLAAYAASHGSVVAGGMSVLSNQAAEQFSLMTGLPAPMDAMRSAGEQALAARRDAAGH